MRSEVRGHRGAGEVWLNVHTGFVEDQSVILNIPRRTTIPLCSQFCSGQAAWPLKEEVALSLLLNEMLHSGGNARTDVDLKH